MSKEKFSLNEEFVKEYDNKKAPFGFNGLGELTYIRTYSRIKDDGSNEDWKEIIERVTNGTYSIQKRWIKQNKLRWNEKKAKLSAQTMFDKIFNMKFMPPGRGLWSVGSPIIEERELFAAANNCGFCTTEHVASEGSKPFRFLMDMSMLGVGIGFDVKGEGSFTIQCPSKNSAKTIKIEDTREGWIDSTADLIDSFFFGTDELEFDYSAIRLVNEPIKGFGGVSSGPQPLIDLHNSIRKILGNNTGKKITSTIIVDLMNLIGKAVVAGNVRRTAEIVFGDPNSEEYLDLKNYQVNPHRAEYGWTSNNSVFANIGMDYTDICDRIQINGEPGLAWLGNMKDYSRMVDPPDYKDDQVAGGNPCIVGSTLIAVADGRNAVQIKDLVDTTYPVYTIKDGQVVIGNSVKTWKTRENAEIWKLTLDDGSILLATPDHKIMLRNGEYIELKNLVAGQSLMPFNSYLSNNNYRQISSNKKRDRRQYRMIAEHNGLIVDPKTTAIHHSDFNSLNDFIDNLIPMSHEEHQKLHSQRMMGLDNPYHRMSDEWRLTFDLRDMSGDKNPMFGKKHKGSTLNVIGKKSKANWANQKDIMIDSIKNGMTTDVKKRISDARIANSPRVECVCPVCDKSKMLVASKAKNFKTCSTSCSNVNRKREKDMYNHKVVSVEFHGYEDVYDMTVEDTHNFGVITSVGDENAVTSSGIFVHNCLEQSLEPYELCTLVETFLNNHETLEEFLETLKYSYLYAKTITLGQTHWEETNEVMMRNRRIGCSLSGVAQFMAKHGIETLRQWLMAGYAELERLDKVYSDWFCVPLSIKKTSNKPSGTVSLVAGAWPGIHHLEARFHIRRMRLSKYSKLIKPLEKAGYGIEPAFGSEDSTVVVSIPVDAGAGIRGLREVSMWEQLAIAAFMQRYWADNQVSVTITFDPVSEGHQIKHALNYYQYQLKGVSFLPRLEYGAYPQMPYEEITEEKFVEMSSKLKTLNFKDISGEEANVEKYCNNDSCQI